MLRLSRTDLCCNDLVQICALMKWRRDSKGFDTYLHDKPGHANTAFPDLKRLTSKNLSRRRTRKGESQSMELSIEECNLANAFNDDELKAYARTLQISHATPPALNPNPWNTLRIIC